MYSFSMPGMDKCLSLLTLVACVVAEVKFPAKPSDLTTPVQQRIAIYGPNEISVGWNTYQKLDKSCVHYGTSSHSLNSLQCSNSEPVTYPTSRTWNNFVVLKELNPGTVYYYKIESTNSTTEHFTSPREAGDTTPFSMDVVIDMGAYGKSGGYTVSKKDTIPNIEPALSHTTIGRLANTINDYEFIIHPGDLAYADNWYGRQDNEPEAQVAYEAVLEIFYDQLAPIAGRKPYMASPGNHEAACGKRHSDGVCAVGQANFTDFMNRFGAMPRAFPSLSSHSAATGNASLAQKLARPPFWYSFEYGMAHIVMFDTETDFPHAPEERGGEYRIAEGPFGAIGQQQEFLKADLASVDRTVTPWIVVAGHRPWYSTAGGAVCKPCKEAFEPIFYQYGVDLAIFGHVHNTQRFLPMYDGALDPAGMNNPKAPMHIIAGAAGNVEGLAHVGANVTGNAFAYADEFAFAKVSFKDSNHLQVDFLNSRTGKVLDSSVLYKNHTQQFIGHHSASTGHQHLPSSILFVFLFSIALRYLF